jgi:hypothetical protein
MGWSQRRLSVGSAHLQVRFCVARQAIGQATNGPRALTRGVHSGAASSRGGPPPRVPVRGRRDAWEGPSPRTRQGVRPGQQDGAGAAEAARAVREVDIVHDRGSGGPAAPGGTPQETPDTISGRAKGTATHPTSRGRRAGPAGPGGALLFDRDRRSLRPAPRPRAPRGQTYTPATRWDFHLFSDVERRAWTTHGIADPDLALRLAEAGRPGSGGGRHQRPALAPERRRPRVGSRRTTRGLWSRDRAEWAAPGVREAEAALSAADPPDWPGAAERARAGRAAGERPRGRIRSRSCHLPCHPDGSGGVSTARTGQTLHRRGVGPRCVTHSGRP